jgi:uncharacterized protein (UPF0147 family)
MKLEPVVKLLTEIVEDRRVPRNIRTSIEEAKKNLTGNDRDLDVKLSSAISILDEITNDPNIPMYTRTQIWNIVSMLEVAKREL